MHEKYTIALIRVILMKLEPSRFSSHCMWIAVLALVAGIVVTVDSAAQQVGIRTSVAERAQNSIVTLLSRKETPALSHDSDTQDFSVGEI